jgi:hypothetical protein
MRMTGSFWKPPVLICLLCGNSPVLKFDLYEELGNGGLFNGNFPPNCGNESIVYFCCEYNFEL